MQYGVLSAVGLSGILLVGMAAPKTLQLLRYIPNNKYRFASQTRSTLSRLASSGQVRFIERNGKRYAKLTESGRNELLTLTHKFGRLGAQRRRWDKRWRVVIFDIPEKKRGVRNRLRNMMSSFGFYRLQDSVWVYPYDCEDVMALLKTDLRLGSAALYMIVESIENDKHLREHFDLA